MSESKTTAVTLDIQYVDQLTDRIMDQLALPVPASIEFEQSIHTKDGAREGEVAQKLQQHRRDLVRTQLAEKLGVEIEAPQILFAKDNDTRTPYEIAKSNLEAFYLASLRRVTHSENMHNAEIFQAKYTFPHKLNKSALIAEADRNPLDNQTKHMPHKTRDIDRLALAVEKTIDYEARLNRIPKQVIAPQSGIGR